jgi:hypothetical protein
VDDVAGMSQQVENSHATGDAVKRDDEGTMPRWRPSASHCKQPQH